MMGKSTARRDALKCGVARTRFGFAFGDPRSDRRVVPIRLIVSTSISSFQMRARRLARNWVMVILYCIRISTMCIPTCCSLSACGARRIFHCLRESASSLRGARLESGNTANMAWLLAVARRHLESRQKKWARLPKPASIVLLSRTGLGLDSRVLP